MNESAHLWAIGYDDVDGAAEVRKQIEHLGRDRSYLILSDVVMVVRHPDGSFSVERETFPTAANILGSTVVGLVAGLVLAAPLGGAVVGALLGGAGSIAAHSVGIADAFIQEVVKMMRPGTSALFVLDDEGDMDVILATIRGLGGTILKTNVDPGRARQIQATLAAPADTKK